MAESIMNHTMTVVVSDRNCQRINLRYFFFPIKTLNGGKGISRISRTSETDSVFHFTLIFVYVFVCA